MRIVNIIRYASLLILASWCALCTVEAENTAAVAEVLKLKDSGVAEDTIVAFIKGKSINYDLSADNILKLRDQGVSAKVLNAMLESGKNVAPPASVWSAPAAQPAQTAPPPAAPAPPSQPQYAPGAPQPVPTSQPAPMAPPAVAPPTVNPDVAYFYQELSPYGRWLLAEDNQWYWQPAVVLTTSAWRPYWDRGHWIYTDNGWYWSSDYPWGWAVFHYGRWHLHPHHGWIWYPDRVWGPAWVVWRSGGDYCGWAPLPPGARFDVVAGRFSFHGKLVEAGFDFGLDWVHFNFSYIREMGEQPRWHWRKEAEVRTVFNRTTIINNYRVTKTIVNGQSREHFVNHGIDPARVSAVKGRAVETVKIEDMRSPAPNRSHERLDPRTKTLEVYRPKMDDHGRR